MDTYRGTAVYLKEHMGVIVVVFGITFVQRMALFAATWFVYRAFGLSGTSFFDILFSSGSDSSCGRYAAASRWYGDQ